MYESEFLTWSPESQDAYREWMSRAVELLCRALPSRPYSGESPASLHALLDGKTLNDGGCEPEELWQRIAAIISNSVNLTHPNTSAHLHCPPLIAGLAAEVVISALNQSMDSFDQAPAATVIEEKMVRWLAREAGLGGESGGVFTAGGSQSNYMALLLARDACLDRHFQWPAQKKGLPAEARRLRILCSDAAHFTVEKSSAQLGLGTESVVRVETEHDFCMSVEKLRTAIRNMQSQELIPMAIVATAGTTDFGSVDPLPEIATLARSVGAWLHVDAAYGSALLFSHKHRDQLHGIEAADSISMDFHKLFWQPISCAALLLRDADLFRYLKMHADYLNPESDEEVGVPNLVNRSVATTRRFDALKLWVTMQALGRKKLGEMIDATIDLAAQAADRIAQDPRLGLVHQPRFGCVVFRYLPENSALDANACNASLRQHLFERGLAVIGHTVLRGEQCLKLTCMNPTVSKGQISDLLQMIVQHGRELEREIAAR